MNKAWVLYISMIGGVGLGGLLVGLPLWIVWLVALQMTLGFGVGYAGRAMEEEDERGDDSST